MTKEKGNRIRVHGNRALGYAEFGDPRGRPVFYFHGFPGSRLEAQLGDGEASRLGVRLIAVDRPGFGLSDFQAGRRIVDWPDDVSALADALGVKRFFVLGVSGGGPYAASCAWKIPDRLLGTTIVCGLGPLDRLASDSLHQRLARPAMALSRRAPNLALPVFQALAWGVRRNPENFLSRFTAGVPEPDRQVLARKDIREILTRSFYEAVSGGAKGPWWDLVLFNRPWGFDLSKIRVDVTLYHGELDSTVPPSMGRFQAKAIPGARWVPIPGEGHFSLPVNRMGEILEDILKPQAR